MMYNDNKYFLYMKVYFSLYKKLYDDNIYFFSSYNFLYNYNICCHYTSYCIRRNTFSCTREIFVDSIYISSYIIINKYCHYTLSCIMRKYIFLCIREINNFVIYHHISRNICCHYTSSRIMKNTFSCITETNISLYIVLYNEDVYCHYTSSLYNKHLYCIIKMFIIIIVFLYNRNKHFIIHRLV